MSEARRPRTRVHNLMTSLDGFSAGTRVTFDEPFGEAFALTTGFDGRVIHGVHRADAPITLDRLLTSTWDQGIGVEIMGRRKFGPQTGPWEPDDDWRGWWGDEPPFRTPVVVLTHHRREPIHFDNGTSFHFLDADPAEALAYATDLADGGDIRLGGGPSSIKEFLAADLVDFLHLRIVPVTVGTGTSIWDGIADLQERFTIESATSASGVTHQFWNRNR